MLMAWINLIYDYNFEADNISGMGSICYLLIKHSASKEFLGNKRGKYTPQGEQYVL